MTAPMSVEALRVDVESGGIDTVVVAIVDMQGRLQGKRFHAPYFVSEVLRNGTEGCNYLLAVDVDMNTRWKSTRLNSSHLGISYAVFCLKKKKKKKKEQMQKSVN